MKKRLDETAILSELSEGSAFFPKSKPVYTASEQANNRTDGQDDHSNVRTVVPTERPNDRTVDATEQTNNRTAAPNEQPVTRTTERSRTTIRPTRRYSFEFYTDQITAIRKLRAQREIRGEQCRLSDLAREAFDQYLKQAETE